VETPRIDRLAAEGARFDRAASAVAITLPSHTSMMTAEFPYRHRVRNNGTYRLGEERTTLAEAMRAEGYATGAFIGSFTMDGRFGLAQGFDVYDDALPVERSTTSLHMPERRADAVVNGAIRWLEEKKRKPFFLFVHLFDVHQPYNPPEPFATRYASSLYDGEVAYVDQELGRLFDALDRLGLSDETLIVLIGDHGQGLGEHGEVTHAMFTYEATIRIPLLIRWPDRSAFERAGFRRGSVVKSLVREVDVAPTILDLAGLPPLPDVEGKSLVPLLRDPSTSLGLVNYAESFSTREDFGWSEVRSVATDSWKYVLVPREELYDLAADPGELENLAAAKPEVVRELRALLEERIRQDEARKGEAARLDVDEETRAKLEALGYLTGEGVAEEDVSYLDLPDPKDRIGLLAEYFAALGKLEKGDLVGGLDDLLRLEKSDPGASRVAASIGDAYLVMGDAVAAESVYAKAIAAGARNIPTRGNHGYSLFLVGKTDEAIEVLRSVIAADPKAARTHARLGDIYLSLGRFAEAADEYRAEMANYPEMAVAHVGLGKAAKEEGRVPDAFEHFKKAAACPDEPGQGYYALGSLSELTGDTARAIGYYKKAIQLDPTIVEAHYNLAILAKKHADRASASKYLNEAVRINPRFAKGHYGVANLLREEGRIEEAVAQYQVALGLNRKDPDIYLNLGVAYATAGDLRRAVEAWELAASLAPDSPSAASARENIRAARAQMGGQS
jgi:arylsulfatase A-like enzyme/Tfp pilus assembly protein PilF